MKKLKAVMGAMLLSGLVTGSYAANPSAKGFTVGQYYNGGVIFWTDPAQKYQHGLIADINDQPTQLAWANAAPCSNTFESITGNGAYTGAANTAQIIQICTAASAPAAAACSNSTAQGYNDWYLPSELELAQMLTNQMTINPAAQANGGSTFASIYGNPLYWSSTEFDAAGAWDFTGYHYNTTNYDKSLPLSVRCVRAF